MSGRIRIALGVVAVALLAVGAGWWYRGEQRAQRDQATSPLSSVGPRPTGEARVWVIDDGERIASGDGLRGWMEGTDNPIWRPGEPVRLFALPGETVAFQVVVTAGSAGLNRVTVDLSSLTGPGAPPQTERFVLGELPMSERSGGRTPGESLGWAKGAMPPGPRPGGALPDPLLAVAVAEGRHNLSQPSSGTEPLDYPMSVNAGKHRVVWIDVTVLEGTTAGRYEGQVWVRGAGEVKIPVELSVGHATLPYRALRNMLFIEPSTLERRGGRASLDPTFQLLHRHHIAPIVPLTTPEDLDRFIRMLDGSLFTAERDYLGPGAGVATDVVALGAYGVLGEPDDEKLKTIDVMLERLASVGLEDDPQRRDIFIYAVDEDCESPRGRQWRQALDRSGSARLEKLRVAHTCSEPPAKQAIDIAIVFAGLYRPETAAEARAAGKPVWIYNGELPATGSYLTDAWPISLRANGWIQAHYDIGRWFFWEGAYWHDSINGGRGPYDPWTTAETFHNKDGDHCNGDGNLLYPGRQVTRGRFNLDVDEAMPSFRLKQWRRGIQDGGYIQLARKKSPEETRAIVEGLVAKSFEATKAPTWPTGGRAWFEARRALFDIIEGR